MSRTGPDGVARVAVEIASCVIAGDAGRVRVAGTAEALGATGGAHPRVVVVPVRRTGRQALQYISEELILDIEVSRDDR